MRYTVRPISDRTPFGGDPRNSPFTVTWKAALDLLDRELWFLDAEDVVLEVDVDERNIRVDGMLRVDAKTKTPAVRLAFDSNQGPLTYATDAFVRPASRAKGMERDWQHNVYAIAKGLEALRLTERYGIIRRGEQYQGFKALPAGRAMPASHMTRTAAAEILERVAIGDEGALRERSVQRILDSEALARDVWKRARGAVHPDRRNGDRTLWDQVEQAADALKLR